MMRMKDSYEKYYNIIFIILFNSEERGVLYGLISTINSHILPNSLSNF